MAGRDDDDHDLYRHGTGPGLATLARWLGRILGVLVGAVAAFYGLALFALRCFDTCPSDPSTDKTILLLSTALVLFGLATVVASVAAATRWARGAAAFVAGLGVLIAGAGSVTLLLVPSIGETGDPGSTGLAGAVALLGGAGIAAGALVARRRTIRAPS